MSLCCIFNYAPHYRLPVYEKIDKEMQADFYFGDRLRNETIKKLDYSKLKGFKSELGVHFYGIFEYTTGWFRLALCRKYDSYLITPNTFAINQWLFLFICFILRKKVYVWMHGIKSKTISRKGLFLSKTYDKLLAGSFLYGHGARDNMIELGFPQEKLHVIYNSLDYDKSLSIRNTLSGSENPYLKIFGNNNPVLLFIGRLTKVKKLDYIVQAYRKLQEKGIQTNVIFIGDGPEKEYLLNDCIQTEEKEHFHFTGALYDEQQIAQYLYHASLCVSPGNVGLTAIHALSYGCPVISNDNFETQMPEYEAIEANYSGNFFIENDVEDMTNKIAEWLIYHTDIVTVHNCCYEIIDTKYNPHVQVGILKNVIESNTNNN